jgi:hypothetical protein
VTDNGYDPTGFDVNDPPLGRAPVWGSDATLSRSEERGGWTALSAGRLQGGSRRCTTYLQNTPPKNPGKAGDGLPKRPEVPGRVTAV